MRLNKMTGRVIATMGIAAMMMTQTAGVMAAEQTENKQLKVVYYNQADYPGKKIGGSTIQAAGCGPTAVAVCYSSLTGKKADVPKMCKQAYKHGWYYTGQGCSHSVVPGLSKLYGMECKGLGMDKDAVEKALRAGHPVVALMGPGDFTKNGHFVVLTRMVGKDKVKIADVGNADPNALQVAVAAAQAVERIGMPEARIILSQAALYIATAPKSNSCIKAIDKAMDVVKNSKTAPVPVHLQDAHYKGSAKLGHGVGYLYAHDYPNHYVRQQYLPDAYVNEKFYEPGDMGYERDIKKHLDKIKSEA